MCCSHCLPAGQNKPGNEEGQCVNTHTFLLRSRAVKINKKHHLNYHRWSILRPKVLPTFTMDATDFRRQENNLFFLKGYCGLHLAIYSASTVYYYGFILEGINKPVLNSECSADTQIQNLKLLDCFSPEESLSLKGCISYIYFWVLVSLFSGDVPYLSLIFWMTINTASVPNRVHKLLLISSSYNFLSFIFSLRVFFAVYPLQSPPKQKKTAKDQPTLSSTSKKPALIVSEVMCTFLYLNLPLTDFSLWFCENLFDRKYYTELKYFYCSSLHFYILSFTPGAVLI